MWSKDSNDPAENSKSARPASCFKVLHRASECILVNHNDQVLEHSGMHLPLREIRTEKLTEERNTMS